MAKKYYVVWEGRNKGIYESWEACREQVEGFEGSKYKGFTDKSEAIEAFRSGWKKTAFKKPLPHSGPIIKKSIAVDAACSGNPGVMEYQGVWTDSKAIVFHKGPFPRATNNIGEFLAIVHALALLKKNNSNLPIYSDSGTALAWIRNKKAKTKLERDSATEQIWDLIERAENWLKANTYSNQILKWDTVKWGEIPADFGRK